jgi:glutamyl-tRNA(Gln) amidotransferase subunit E
MFKFVKSDGIEPNIAKIMLPVVYKYPSMEFKSVLTTVKFKRRTQEELLAPIEFLIEKFREITENKKEHKISDWIMGQIHSQAIGNVDLKYLKTAIDSRIANLATEHKD